MTRQLPLVLLVLVLAGAVLAGGQLPYADTVDAMLSQIGDRGAQKVAVELYDSESWLAVMRHIEAGERDWLLVALGLSRGTDGAASEDLALSVSKALLTNPEAVLEFFLSSTPPRKDLCHGWGEFAGHDTFESAKAEVDAKISKLEAVKNSSLSAPRAMCLDTLRSSLAELREIYGLSPN